MAIIQKHINITNVPMLREELGGWDTNAVVLGREGMVQGYAKNDTLDYSSDFSSFTSYNLHLHYERS